MKNKTKKVVLTETQKGDVVVAFRRAALAHAAAWDVLGKIETEVGAEFDGVDELIVSLAGEAESPSDDGRGLPGDDEILDMVLALQGGT